MSDKRDEMLQVKNLKTYIYTSHGITKAIDDGSFDIRKGEVFGLVGESGSGKTMTALSILKLIPRQAGIVGGEILFKGVNLANMDDEYLRAIRGAKISMVFQEPAGSFNPVFTIGEQIVEAALAHRKVNKKEAQVLALEYLRKVHVAEPSRIFHNYPHQLSGGTKQRAMIAMALVNSPELVILDEPNSALDVTVQAKILDLLDEIIKEGKLSVLCISHNFRIIARMCGRIAVMRQGRIVELNSKEEIFSNPKNEYTISLLESVRALS